MTDLSDTTTRASQLQQIRALLAAIHREASNKGLAEVVDLAKKADDLAVDLQRAEGPGDDR